MHRKIYVYMLKVFLYKSPLILCCLLLIKVMAITTVSLSKSKHYFRPP